jgi:hypothetical protein
MKAAISSPEAAVQAAPAGNRLLAALPTEEVG